MGVILILGIIVAISIAIAIYEECTWNELPAAAAIFAGIGLIFGSALLILSIFGAILTQVNSDVVLNNKIEERNAIVYRLEQTKSDENFLINGGVYNDVVSFNNSLRKYKKWGDSFWFGVFYEDGVEDIDYIPLPNGSE